MSDSIKIRGRWILELSDGQVLQGSNLITTIGKQVAAQRFIGVGPVPAFAGLGTGTTAAAVGNAALVAEIAGSRKAWDGPGLLLGTEVSFQATFVPLAVPWNVREIGIFTELVGGLMIARFIPPAHTIGVGLSSVLTWLVNFGG